MSDSQNPYESPAAVNSTAGTDVTEGASAGVITETMARWLGEASPWMRFLGVMGYIGAGFIILAGIIIMVSGTAVAAMGGVGGAFGAGMGFGLGLLYLAIGALYFFPSRFMWNAGSRIKSWKQSQSSLDLEKALENNKSLWKFAGIVTIVSLAVMPVVMIIAVAVGVSSAF